MTEFGTSGEFPRVQTTTSVSGYMRGCSVKAYVGIDFEPFPNMTVQVSKARVGNEESLPVLTPCDLAPWGRIQELFLSLWITSCLPDVR